MSNTINGCLDTVTLNLNLDYAGTGNTMSASTSHLPTAKEYREAVNKIPFEYTGQWSEPKYQCPKCDGGMCKNLLVVCTSIPPQYEYQCDKCGYKEYQRG